MTFIDTQTDLYLDQLRDLFSAESQISLTIDWLAERTSSDRLRRLLREHRLQTDSQKERIRQVFERYSCSPTGDPCQAIIGLIHGGNRHLEMTANPEVRDLLMIAHFLRVKHYGFVVTLAQRLQLDEDAARFSESLNEEREVIDRLEVQSAQLALPPGNAKRPEAGQDAARIAS